MHTQRFENTGAPGDVENAESMVVVITGCTGGMGKALAAEFISMGHTVACCGRRASAIEALQLEFGPQHLFLVADVSNEEDMMKFAAAVDAAFPQVHIVYANAAVSTDLSTAPWEVETDTFRKILDVNVVGVFLTFKYFTPMLLKSEVAVPNKLVVASSGAAHSIAYLNAAYGTSKWAVENLAKSTAEYIRHNGLEDRLVCVPLAPGHIYTGMDHDDWAAPVEKWAPVAARYILSLTPEQSGASLYVPGFYPLRWVKNWILPNGFPSHSD